MTKTSFKIKNTTVRLNYYMILHLNLIKKIQHFCSKQRNRIICEYDKNVDKKNNTKIRFVNHFERQMNKVETEIYTTLQL